MKKCAMLWHTLLVLIFLVPASSLIFILKVKHQEWESQCKHKNSDEAYDK